jgi:RHS repeat-associated protein
MYANTGTTGGQIFTGDTHLSIGLFETSTRELNQAQGRFLNPDSARAGWNQYGYPVNPNMLTDPSGQCDQQTDGTCPDNIPGPPLSMLDTSNMKVIQAIVPLSAGETLSSSLNDFLFSLVSQFTGYTSLGDPLVWQGGNVVHPNTLVDAQLPLNTVTSVIGNILQPDDGRGEMFCDDRIGGCVRLPGLSQGVAAPEGEILEMAEFLTQPGNAWEAFDPMMQGALDPTQYGRVVGGMSKVRPNGAFASIDRETLPLRLSSAYYEGREGMWSVRDHLYSDARNIMTPEQIAEYGGRMPLATDEKAWVFDKPITVFMKWENYYKWVP